MQVSACVPERPLMSFRPNARSLRFALVALFAAGGLLLWGELAPVEGHVSFRIPPSVKSGAASVRRSEIRALRVMIRDASGELVAQSEQDLIEPLKAPVTPPVYLRLPRGEYTTVVTLATADGRTALLRGRLALEKDGYHRVDLGRSL